MHCVGPDGIYCFAHFPGELPHKMPYQERNVFRAFAQRGNRNRNHIQPVVKVAAKLPFQHHLFQAAMGRGHHSNIQFLRPRTAQPFEFAFLQNAQESVCRSSLSLPDIARVEICDFKPAGSFLPRTTSVNS